MKDNKGFTLIEVLAVVAVLIVVLSIITPKVIKQFSNAGDITQNEQINSIINIAKLYTNQNTDLLPDDNGYSAITLDELKNSGLTNSNRFLNPKTKEEITGCIVVSGSHNMYKYEYRESCDVDVVFDPTGGSVSPTTKTFSIGSKFEELPVPTKSGYTFKGWIGKNIFDIDHFMYTYSKYMSRKPEKVNFDGYDVYKMFGGMITFGLDYHYMQGMFKENTQYTVSLDIYDVFKNGSEGIVMYFKYSDGTEDKILPQTRLSDQWQSYELTSAEGKTISYIRVTYMGSGLAYSYLKNFQIEEGTSKTSYEPYRVYNGNSYVGTDGVLYALWGSSPELVLSKETYKNIDFSDWTLVNSTVSDGELIIGNGGSESPSAVSDFIDVNGDFWYMTFDVYTEVPSAYYTPFNGVHWGTNYYNSQKQASTSLSGSIDNGYSTPVNLYEWEKDLYWYTLDDWRDLNRYGPNVKYVVMSFPGDRMQTPIILKNLKVYGQMINSFYLINADIDNGEGIVVRKYDKGEKSANYFKTSGTSFEGNQITVTSNGIYTVYIEDGAGNYSIDTIEITNIR